MAQEIDPAIGCFPPGKKIIFSHMKNTASAAVPVRYMAALLLIAAVLCVSCGGKKERLPPITAQLIEENRQLFLVLRNHADSALVICTRNFYDPIQCLDIRNISDTTGYSTDLLFGGVQAGVVRTIITMDEFVSLDTGRELRLPVDLRPVRKNPAAGRPVLISVYFKNIDPFACSRVDVSSYDKATQNYCTLMHYVPNRSWRYWIGEVRTPYLPVNLSYFVQQQQKKKILAIKKRTRAVVVRRSRTHPLNHKVF
jgi:hypothetical protein